MKISIFYPRNVYASWYALGGYAETLERMGYEVLDCPFPGNLIQDVPRIRQLVPTIEQLVDCDCILVAFAEYVQPWLNAVYGWDAWQRVMAKVPVIARFDESFDREDLALPARWDYADVTRALKPWAHYHSFPAAQDAERFGGQWDVYGADTKMFHTNGTWPPDIRKYGVSFIGTLYPVRQKYLEALFKAAKGVSDFTFQLGQVLVQDLSGIRFRESTELLAENYRQIKVFFCLPPMSRLLVCKVFEVMACGTMVMFPRLPGEAGKNLSVFEHEKEIVYYEHGLMEQNLAAMRHYLENDEDRERIAKAGFEKVSRNHQLEQMLASVLSLVLPVRPDILKSVAVTV